MKYKTVVKVLVLAFFLFLLIVVLGSKFNWVKYLKEKPVVQGQDLAESDEALDEADASIKKKPSAVNVEIVSDVKVSNTTEQAKNDCIRASRRAGVGDSEIHAVVRECVELSLQTKKNQVSSAFNNATSSDTDNNRDNGISPLTDSNMSLTRGACEMVVADETTLNTEEKEALITQCVKENSQ